MEIRNLMTFEDRAGLRRWLEENHGQEGECWVACYRGKVAMAEALPYVEVVLEALWTPDGTQTVIPQFISTALAYGVGHMMRIRIC